MLFRSWRAPADDDVEAEEVERQRARDRVRDLARPIVDRHRRADLVVVGAERKDSLHTEQLAADERDLVIEAVVRRMKALRENRRGAGRRSEELVARSHLRDADAAVVPAREIGRASCRERVSNCV